MIAPLPDSVDEDKGSSSSSTEQLQKSKGEDDIFTDLGQGGKDSLGPITERFMVVKRGMDVVLECRDPDGGAEVLWRKQGGKTELWLLCQNICVQAAACFRHILRQQIYISVELISYRQYYAAK